jgi:two-component system, OmpR family, KDP operon response regulator KdpE
MQALSTPGSPPTFHDKHLHVDLGQQAVTLDGETVRLTPIQYRLLMLLVEHAGVAVTRPILLMQIWRDAPEIREHKVDTCIRGLRKKLGVYADHYIETVVGIGYRFRPAVPPSD